MVSPRLVSTVGLTLLAACASSGPELRSNETSATVRISTGDGRTMQTEANEGSRIASFPIAASVADAWASLPAAYEALGFEVNSGDPRGRILGVENVRLRRIDGTRPSNYLECGQGPVGANADQYDVYFSMLAQVMRAAEGSTLNVRILANARNAAHGGVGVTCATKGTIEERLAEELRIRVE